MSKKIIGIIAAIAVVVIIVLVATNKPESPAAEEQLIVNETEEIVPDSISDDLSEDSVAVIEIDSMSVVE